MKRIASILSAILLVNNLATVGLAYENYETEQVETVTEYEVVEDTTDLPYQNFDDSEIATLSEVATEVPYGRYMTRNEIFWNAFVSDGGTWATILPEGWEIFDIQSCSSSCGMNAIGIQGDGVYAIIHEYADTKYPNVSGVPHYYQWTVILEDGTPVNVNRAQ